MLEVIRFQALPKMSSMPMSPHRHNEIVVMGLETSLDLQACLADQLLQLSFHEQVIEPFHDLPVPRAYRNEDVGESLFPTFVFSESLLESSLLERPDAD